MRHRQVERSPAEQRREVDETIENGDDHFLILVRLQVTPTTVAAARERKDVFGSVPYRVGDGERVW